METQVTSQELIEAIRSKINELIMVCGESLHSSKIFMDLVISTDTETFEITAEGKKNGVKGYDVDLTILEEPVDSSVSDIDITDLTINEPREEYLNRKWKRLSIESNGPLSTSSSSTDSSLID